MSEIADPATVLIVEDDPSLNAALAATLKAAGCRPVTARTAAEGLRWFAHYAPDIVLLDLGLPTLSGTAVLREARARGLDIPVLIISARDAMEDRIQGLDLGADDYLVKPFEPAELQARIRAVLRRHAGHAQSLLKAGEVVLDLASHGVSYRGTSLTLPTREFALLHILAQRPGMIFARAVLEERLYGWGQEVESNAIEVLIHYIRRKFDREIIRNVRGTGWMIPRSA